MPVNVTEDVPLELLDDVLEEVAESRDSLRALSLTCRFFLPLCQSRLFSRIDIDISSTKCDKATQLLSLLKDSPHLATYTSDLSIEFRDISAEKTQNCLASLLPYFRNIKKFSLRKHYEDRTRFYLNKQIVVSLAEILRLPSLTRVALYGAPVELVGLCSTTLKRLDYYAMGDQSKVKQEFLRELSDVVCLPKAIQLDSLWLWPFRDISHLEREKYEQTGIDFSRMRQLSITASYWTEVEANTAVPELLHASRESLEVLSLDTDFGVPNDYRFNTGKFITLGSLPSLQNLHFVLKPLILRGDQQGIHRPMDWVARTLERVSELPRLEMVVLSIPGFHLFTYGYHITTEDVQGEVQNLYRRLSNALLDQERFPALRKLIFHDDNSPLHGPGFPGHFMLRQFKSLFLPNGLKRLDEKDMLEFSFGYPYGQRWFPLI